MQLRTPQNYAGIVSSHHLIGCHPEPNTSPGEVRKETDPDILLVRQFIAAYFMKITLKIHFKTQVRPIIWSSSHSGYTFKESRQYMIETCLLVRSVTSFMAVRIWWSPTYPRGMWHWSFKAVRLWNQHRYPAAGNSTWSPLQFKNGPMLFAEK